MTEYSVDTKAPGCIVYLASIGSIYDGIIDVRFKSGEATTSASLPRIDKYVMY